MTLSPWLIEVFLGDIEGIVRQNPSVSHLPGVDRSCGFISEGEILP